MYKLDRAFLSKKPVLDFFLMHKLNFKPLQSISIESPLRTNYLILYFVELVVFSSLLVL